MGHDWSKYISIADAARMNDHCRVYCINHQCDNRGYLYFAPLLEKHSPHTSLGVILRAMRCSKCGELGARPIAEPGTKEHPARKLFCAIHTDNLHPCDPLGACKDDCQLGPVIRSTAPNSY